MGLDLWIAIGFIAAVSGLAFRAGQRLSLSVRRLPLLFAECLAVTLVFAFGVADSVGWAAAFPSAAAVCWSNWLPILLSLTAGMALGVPGIRPQSRRLVCATLMTLGVVFLFLPVARPLLFPIEVAEVARWKNGVCLQSNEASCGPAAAATLLHQAGLLDPVRVGGVTGGVAPESSASAEKRMARACLTSRHGTSALGLIRGLHLAVSATQRSVGVADSDPEFWSSKDQLPNVAVFRFRDHQGSGPVRFLLGRDGERHAVVVHSRTADGRWKIADPAAGWRFCEPEEFQRLFTGEAIYLTPKHGGRPESLGASVLAAR